MMEVFEQDWAQTQSGKKQDKQDKKEEKQEKQAEKKAARGPARLVAAS